MYYEHYEDEGEDVYDTVGVTNEDTYTESLFCNSEYQEYTITELDRTNYVYLTMNKEDGTLLIESEHYEKYMDYEASNCTDGIVYHDGTRQYSSDGAWSWDDSDKMLTL